jgi:small-conductance mechanosensitive channel
VAYKEDPEQVRAILTEVAANCPVLLKYPAPLVVLENFGASSLDFSVRGYIADVNTTLSSSTQLRLDIVRAFKEHNIEIPFPQQDIHLRDLDGIKDAFARAVAERALNVKSEKATSEASAGAGASPPGGSGGRFTHGNDNEDEGPAKPQ